MTTNSNGERGFAPLVIVAIVALLAVGGGAVYVATKSDTRISMEEGDATSMETSMETEAGAEVSAMLDARGSLRSLLGLGQSVMCTFSSTDTVESSGTVYVAANGSMRTDFRTETSGGVRTGSMIVKDGASYVWSGAQGMKMSASGSAQANANASAEAEQSVDLDTPVDYDCQNWREDSSKFTPPANVEFVDMQAMMQGALEGLEVDVEALMQGTIQ